MLASDSLRKEPKLASLQGAKVLLHVTAHAATAATAAAPVTASVGVARRSAVPVTASASATASATATWSTPVPSGELHPPPLRACSSARHNPHTGKRVKEPGPPDVMMSVSWAFGITTCATWPTLVPHGPQLTPWRPASIAECFARL